MGAVADDVFTVVVALFSALVNVDTPTVKLTAVPVKPEPSPVGVKAALAVVVVEVSIASRTAMSTPSKVLLVVTGPVRAPPALGKAASAVVLAVLAVVLAASAVVVVEVSIASLVAMSTPSKVEVVVIGPVNAAPAKSALRLASVVTKAVVATCVVLVSAAAVGAEGTPVNVGLARLDLVAEAVARLLNSTSNSVPLIVLRGLPEARVSFDAKSVVLT